MKNLLIGAISGNYNVSDVKRWLESSDDFDVTRVLLLYNATNRALNEYLLTKNVTVIVPKHNFYSEELRHFETNTANNNLETSYNLIHNIRFFHIWQLLNEEDSRDFESVLITDVRDVYFNGNPFHSIPTDKLIVSSEVIEYESEEWNKNHLFSNLGAIGADILMDKEVYNVGVFGGKTELVKEIARDIYLLSVGKPLVADQTSFNYLIQTTYKDKTIFTNLDNNFAVHLHVIVSGKIKFDLKTIDNYLIVHQWDRL